MPIVTWITNNVFETMMIIGVIAVIILLGLIANRMGRPASVTYTVDLENNVEKALQRVIASVGHAADVSAVVKLIKGLDADPDALELIKSYPETVRAAAWLHRINTLGADLQEAQKRLSDAHTGKDRMGRAETNIARCQAHVNMIAKKLDEAITASGQRGLRSM